MSVKSSQKLRSSLSFSQDVASVGYFPHDHSGLLISPYRAASAAPVNSPRLVSMPSLASAKEWARRIKRDVMAVYFAGRDPETPIFVRLLALAVAAYALSPIDLIPDFIPVLGYLDDLLIVPLGLYLVIQLLPPPVLAASRIKAEAFLERPKSFFAAAFVVIFWLLLSLLAYDWFLRR